MCDNPVGCMSSNPRSESFCNHCLQNMTLQGQSNSKPIPLSILEMEELAIQSALNMGASDTLIFPDMTEEEFIALDRYLKKEAANKAMDELAEETQLLEKSFEPENLEWNSNTEDFVDNKIILQSIRERKN